jgi:hypothetical protein
MFRDSRSKVLACLGITAVSYLLTATSISSADIGDCDQPVTEGASPTAVDCMFILKAAAGVTTCSPECICDPTGDETITVSDALSCLMQSIDMPVALVCCGATTSTTTTLGECAAFGEACGEGLPCCHYSCGASGFCCKNNYSSCFRDSDCCSGRCDRYPDGSGGICSRYPR